MNCKSRMSFEDFIFPVNPYKLSITHQRTVPEKESIDRQGREAGIGKKRRVFSGEGEFFGEHCGQDFERLKQLYEKGTAGILYVPSQKPVLAVLQMLELLGEDLAEVIRYRFSFVEQADTAGKCLSPCRLGNGSRSLWDFANETGISVELLRELNPELRRPDCPVPVGKKVRLC